MQRWGFAVDRWTLAEELWRWGEDDLAAESLSLPDDTLFDVWVAAGDVARERRAEKPSRAVGWAVASGAVRVLTGEARPLARKRRRPKKEVPDFGGTTDERARSVTKLAQRPWPKA